MDFEIVEYLELIFPNGLRYELNYKLHYGIFIRINFSVHIE